MQGDHALSTDLSFNTDGWVFEGTDYEDEFRDAVKTVRNDHDERVLIDADSLYKLLVRWNDGTDEVQFDVFALTETFAVVDEDDEGEQ